MNRPWGPTRFGWLVALAAVLLAVAGLAGAALGFLTNIYFIAILLGLAILL